MSMRVVKFGGTSVGSPENIKKIVSIIREKQLAGQNPLVVCSAFGGVTDELISSGELAKSKDENYKNLYNSIKIRHIQAIETLISGNEKQSVLDSIESEFKELKNILEGIYLLGEFPDKTWALIVSFGERLSNYIVAATFRNAGIQASYVDARNLIKTNSEFLSAKVDFDETNKNITDYFKTLNGVAVITGFIGSDEKNTTTTLGRGGSDFTASIFGAALDVEEIEIWTDVDGVLTADPRRVEQAFPINELSYKEAMEMSHFGAKVIYPPTIQPAMNKKIPLRIKNTFNPSAVGTRVCNNPEPFKGPIKGISSIGNVALCRFEGSGLVGVVGMAAKLFNALSRAEINIIFLTQGSSEHSICFGVQPADAPKAAEVVQKTFPMEIQALYIQPLIIESNKSIIAVIGENMSKVPGIAARVFKALGNNGINVSAIAQGSSELNISVVINKEHEAKALNALHEIFFENDDVTLNLFIVGYTGLIGKTLLQQIKNQREHLKINKNIEINVIGLTNSSKMLINSNGINLNHFKEEIDLNGFSANLYHFIDQMISLDFANTILVDCSASGKVVESYKNILEKSISIVTPNKIANTLSFENYSELHKAAKKHNAYFMYETNVGAGLPVINTLRSLLNSGDEILKIEAVLSGSLSFIFNNFKGDKQFSEVVLEARERGYTEPDPRDDLSGLDVARKALILSREIGLRMELSDIQVESLVPETLRACDKDTYLKKLPEFDGDFAKMKEACAQKNETLRYMAVIEKGKVSVSMVAVSGQHPFYNLSGSDNMIVFTTKRYQENPLIVKGPGAGAEVTAAGVFAEIISIGNYRAS